MLLRTNKRIKSRSLVILHMLTDADSSREQTLRAGLYSVCRCLDTADAALTSHTGELAVPECHLHLWGPVTRMEVSGENRDGDVGNAFRICSCNSNGLFRSLLPKRGTEIIQGLQLKRNQPQLLWQPEGMWGGWISVQYSWMLYKAFCSSSTHVRNVNLAVKSDLKNVLQVILKMCFTTLHICGLLCQGY